MANTVVITGASRGIGAACALRFGQAGWNVVINYNRSEWEAFQLAQKIQELGANALAVKADVANPQEVHFLAQEALREFGKIDVLINNAGVSFMGLLTDMSYEDWRKLMSVDFDSVFLCCREILPHMIRRHQGAILNISSMWGQVGASCEAAYSAAKAGVIGLTKALAKEVGPSGIRVNCIAPGVICTDMNQSLSPDILESLRQDTPLEVLGSPADVANTAFFLSSPESAFITGQVLGVNGGHGPLRKAGIIS